MEFWKRLNYGGGKECLSKYSNACSLLVSTCMGYLLVLCFKLMCIHKDEMSLFRQYAFLKIHLVTLSLLIGEFNSLIFKVINDPCSSVQLLSRI